MRQIKKGSVDRSVDLYIIDETTGVPETGVLFNTSGIDLKYRRSLSAAVAITEVTLAALTTAHTDGGFLEIGNGLYRLDLPDAAWASGADRVSIFGTVTGMIVLPQTVQLVDYDPEDTVRLGLTAMPAAVPGAAGGLFIAGTNAATAITTGLTSNVIGNVTGNLSGSVGSVTAGVTLAAAAVQAIWDALTSALTTVGSIGKLLVDNINATISSRLASASYTAPPTAADNADAVWDEATAGHAAAGSTGEALSDAGGAGTPLDAAGVRAAVGLAAANLDTQLGDLPTNAELATALGTADDAVMARLGAPVGASLSADIAAAKTQVAAIETDTQDIQARLPAALTAGGNMKADTLRFAGVPVTGNGVSPKFGVT